MTSLNVYDDDQNDTLQAKRFAGCIGSLAITAFCLWRVLFTSSNLAVVYQEELMGFWIAMSGLAIFVTLACLLGLFANSQNNQTLTDAEMQRANFYAREDCDIALFLDQIQQTANRQPVLDEYSQILAFAHKKKLAFYEDHAQEVFRNAH